MLDDNKVFTNLPFSLDENPDIVVETSLGEVGVWRDCGRRQKFGRLFRVFVAVVQADLGAVGDLEEFLHFTD